LLSGIKNDQALEVITVIKIVFAVVSVFVAPVLGLCAVALFLLNGKETGGHDEEKSNIVDIVSPVFSDIVNSFK
jgi:hypothetical protein